MTFFKTDRMRAIDRVIDYFGERALPPADARSRLKGLDHAQGGLRAIFTRRASAMRRLAKIVVVHI